jgi:hypothetical protein
MRLLLVPASFRRIQWQSGRAKTPPLLPSGIAGPVRLFACRAVAAAQAFQ